MAWAPFQEDLQTMGLNTLFRPYDDYGLSLILGGAETTLWDITHVYANMGNRANGMSALKEFSLLEGEHVRRVVFPIKQSAAWLTLEALKNVKRPGVAAAWEEFSSSQDIAWKTGTSYGWHDAWAVGTNGHYTVGVWTGNANNEEGRNLTGSKAAAPVMLDVFRLLSGAWPQRPMHRLKQVQVCRDDGYLVSADCKTITVDLPIEASFAKASPYHRRLHLDMKSGNRVHAHCESVSNMKTFTHFLLPPVAEYYYRKIDPNYKNLPQWRPDCLDGAQVVESLVPMELEYPKNGAKIKIPVELNGELGRTVFRAHHRKPSTPLYWHLNKEYLGETRYIHEKEIVANQGWHELVIVDQSGYRISRWFRVI